MLQNSVPPNDRNNPDDIPPDGLTANNHPPGEPVFEKVQCTELETSTISSSPAEHTCENESHPVRDIPASGIEAEREVVSLLERMLDPTSLKLLMSCGGGLLVIGLITWLWSIGLFESPVVMAGAMGFGNLALLVGGISLVKKTRYVTAGHALSLLACLLLPLNLWFYDAQGLITVKQGGHLWIPALVCCVIYAGVVWVLREPAYMYSLVGGVAMTGLLLLADQRIGRIWEILSPTTFLIVMGAICIHLERLFLPGEIPFSRESFGRSLYRSGQFAMATGLGILLIGRLPTWLLEACWNIVLPNASGLTSAAMVAPWPAFALVLLATYVYVYSYVLINRSNELITTIAMTTTWSLLLLLDALRVTVTFDHFVLMLGVVSLGLQVVGRLYTRWTTSDYKQAFGHSLEADGARLGPWIATAALIRFFFQAFSKFDMNVPPCGDIPLALLTALALSSVATLWGVVGRLQRGIHHPGVNVSEWSLASGVLTGICTIFLVFCQLGSDQPLSLALVTSFAAILLMWCPKSSSGAWIATLNSAGAIALYGLTFLAISDLIGCLNLVRYHGDYRSILFILLAIFGGLVARRTDGYIPMSLAAFWGWSAINLGLEFIGCSEYSHLIAASFIGATGFAFSSWIAGNNERGVTITENISTSFVVLGGAGGILLILNRIAGREAEWSLLWLAIGQAVVAAIVIAWGKSSELRRITLGLLLGHIVMAGLIISVLSTLTFGQRIEVLSLVCGIALLIAGHVGWHIETEEHDAAVSLFLGFGSLLASVPLIWGIYDHRFNHTQASLGWVLFHEAGGLAIGLIMLGSGVLCRIKSTTLFGGSLLVFYLVSLLGLIHLPNQLRSVAVYLMVGGALFFATAVLLSIYRDRLLSLPKRFSNREGVFRVLNWR